MQKTVKRYPSKTNYFHFARMYRTSRRRLTNRR